MGSKQWGFVSLIAAVGLAAVTGGASLGLLGGLAPATISTIGAGLAATSFVASTIAGRLAQREAREAANASLQDRTQTIRSTDEPRAMLYGRQRVGGVLTFVSQPFGTQKHQVTLVYTLVGHACDAVEALWINDEPVTVDAGTGYVTGSPSGKWQSLRTEMVSPPTVVLAGVWSSASPSVNRIGAPPDSIAVVSVSWINPENEFVLAQPGTDYTVIANSFDVGVINPELVGRQVSVTYNRRVPLKGSIRVRFYTGHETGDARRDMELETNSGGEWLATSTGGGLCRMHVTFSYDETMFADGMPSASAIVRGRRLYDPRLDSTNGGTGSHRYNDPATWTWSRNPALCARDYLTHEWGGEVAQTRIDEATVRAAADACDELRGLTAVIVEPRFTCDGWLSTSAAPLDNLQEICGAMAGFAAPSGGKWRIMAGAWTAPAADALLSDHHVVGDVEITVAQDAGQVANCVRGHYRDEKTWQTTDFPVYRSATYIAQDGGVEAWADYDLPLTLHPVRAQQMGKLLLFLSRQALTFSATFSIAAWRYQPGDRLRLMLTEYGWDAVVQDGGTGKVFRVVERQWVFPDLVRLTLIEDAAAVYAWTYSEATNPDPTPNTTLPSASVVQAPTNFEGSAGPDDFTLLPGGTRVGHIRLTWDEITDSGVLAGGWLELRWKRIGENDGQFRILRLSPFSTDYKLEGLSANEILNIGLTAVNASQARSSMTLIEGNIGTLQNGVFSVGAAFIVAAGGTLWGGNLLPNSSWQFDADGWVMGSASPTAQFIRDPAASWALAGPPSWNVALYESTSRADAILLTTAAPIKVQAGERFLMTARFVTITCNAVCHIAWIDANGNGIGAGAYGPLVSGGLNSAILDGYTTHEDAACYGTAPPSAVAARPYIISYGTLPGAPASSAAITQPLFCELVGADAVPLWSPGPTGRVTTDAIYPGAATAVLTSTLASSVALPVNVCSTPLLSRTLDNVQTGETVLITIRGQVTCTSPSLVRVADKETLFTDPFGQSKVDRDWMVVQAGSRVPFLITNEYVYTPNKFATGLPIAGLYASVNTGSATLDAATIRVEIIKR